MTTEFPTCDNCDKHDNRDVDWIIVKRRLEVERTHTKIGDHKQRRFLTTDSYCGIDCLIEDIK